MWLIRGLGWLVVAIAVSHAVAGSGVSAASEVSVKTQAILAHAFASGDWSTAADDIEHLFTLATASRGQDSAGFVEAAAARRLIRMMGDAPGAARQAAAPVLQRYPELARTLALLLRPDDDVERVLGTVADLHAAHGDALAEYTALAAAVAVVHDVPVLRSAGDGLYPPATAVEVFRHFTRHHGQMVFDVRSAPPELLVFLVQNDASVGEMRWALQEYAGSRQVGRAFFDVPYDTAHLKTGREKRITDEGYTLQNLKRHGGICADQAYFASHVGRAIGVPSVYVWARGGQMAHAWVGFLENGRDGLRWNFDFGRYAEYRGVRGNVADPQTGGTTADGVLSVTALLFRTPEAKRRYAIAAIDAASRSLGRHEKLGLRTTKDAEDAAALRMALALVEEGLRASPAHVDGWRLVGELARDGVLPTTEKTRWADAVLKLCGPDSPDFVIEVLEPFIATVPQPEQRIALWRKVGEALPRERKDLAAHVLMAQAQGWLSAGKKAKAGECYFAVLERYINDGPFVLEALEACAGLLAEAGRRAQVVGLYEDAWKRAEHPASLPADRVAQSTWYKVGSLYADKLADAGDLRGADRVRQRLERLVRD